MWVLAFSMTYVFMYHIFWHIFYDKKTTITDGKTTPYGQKLFHLTKPLNFEFKFMIVPDCSLSYNFVVILILLCQDITSVLREVNIT